MSHAVGLSQNAKELDAAYKAVISGDEDAEWAVFGYKGATNDLKVVETGGTGLILYFSKCGGIDRVL